MGAPESVRKVSNFMGIDGAQKSTFAPPKNCHISPALFCWDYGGPSIPPVYHHHPLKKVCLYKPYFHWGGGKGPLKFSWISWYLVPAAIRFEKPSCKSK